MQHHYFAAANSSEGFKSYFEEIFGAADMLYVIKGGPGTGKSSFMKKIAAAAERRGRMVEYYFCSSDPSSIDGVLILGGDETVGIIDGTAPHTFEPTYPGAREEILNFGEFWNRELLRGQKNEIFALSNKKSAAYKRAYSYLRSCGNLRAVTDSLLRRATDFEKLQAAALRLADSLGMDRGKMTVKPEENGYGYVESKTERERVALLSSSPVYEVKDTLTTYAVNVTEGDRIILVNGEKQKMRACIFNSFGEKIQSFELAEELKMTELPVGGYLELRENRAL
jgi:hypothetical protein